MKKRACIQYLSIIFLFFSCTKNADNTILSGQTITVLESRYMFKDLDSTILTIKMDPVVTCYSYRNGETPKPCDIFITITCELSRPIKGLIKAEINRIDNLEINKSSGAEELPSIVLNIAPNSTRVTLNTNISNSNNQNISDLFRIGSVTVYNLVN
jgi:hypothetical protein